MTSLSRFYQQLAKERMQAELLEVRQTAFDVETTQIDLDQLSSAAITLVNKRLIQVAVEKPGSVRELVSLARIIVASEAVEVKKAWVQLEEDRRAEAVEKGLAKAKREKEVRLQLEAMFDHRKPKMLPPSHQIIKLQILRRTANGRHS